MNTAINLEYYRIFYTAAEYGSISAASAILHNGQPNLTRSIRNLEALLGCTLLNRSNRGITLTPEGEILFAHLKTAFAEMELAERELDSVKQMESGSLNIAVTEVALRCFLLPLLKNFHLQFPHIHLQIGNQLTKQAIQSVQEGKVDFAVVTLPQNISISEINGENLSFSLMETIEEVCVTSCQTAPAVTDVQELAEQPLISLSENTVTAQSYRKFFAQYGCSFQPQIETATADQILPLVKANLGFGFVPRNFLFGESEVREVALRQEIPKRNILAVFPKDRNISFAAKCFLGKEKSVTEL